MAYPRSLTLLTVGAIAVGTIVLAQSAEDSVKFRRAHMTLLAANIGVLGGMARGNMDYDADAATVAATNLAAIAHLDQGAYWPEGSSNADIEGTKALPAIWADMAAFQADIDELRAATEALVPVAGTGLEALQGAMGAVGGACGGCHENFRAE